MTEMTLSLVNRLIEKQFPHWYGLSLNPIHSYGTDHHIFRLGTDKLIRFPRVEWADLQIKKEHRFLPTLAQGLPLAIPNPIALGLPDEGYPWHWGIYKWISGQNATLEQLSNPIQEAKVLAQFINALQRISPADGPPPGQHNVFRGVPLARRDEAVRTAISNLQTTHINTKAAAQAWEHALQTPEWVGPPVWVHGDLHPGNLLVERGKLSAVIDFGALCVGDPANDLIVAWDLFSADARDVFRDALSIDEDTWSRGRGWALSFGLIALSIYMESNPMLTEISQRLIAEVLADFNVKN